MEPRGREPESPREPEGEGFERWLGPYFRDPGLWPVLAAMVLIAATALAALILLAAVDGNLGALAGLLLLAWATADASRRERRASGRLGLLGRTLLALWGLGLAGAAAAWRAGLF